MKMMMEKMVMMIECVMLVMGFLCHQRFTSHYINTNWMASFGSGGCLKKGWEVSLQMTWGENNTIVCTLHW